MDQLELVFRLLVRLQLMYLQYNVYLSIVVRTYIYTHAREVGCKKEVICHCMGVSNPCPALVSMITPCTSCICTYITMYCIYMCTHVLDTVYIHCIRYHCIRCSVCITVLDTVYVYCTK